MSIVALLKPTCFIYILEVNCRKLYQETKWSIQNRSLSLLLCNTSSGFCCNYIMIVRNSLLKKEYQICEDTTSK